jgi:hypothetical protein
MAVHLRVGDPLLGGPDSQNRPDRGAGDTCVAPSESAMHLCADPHTRTTHLNGTCAAIQQVIDPRCQLVEDDAPRPHIHLHASVGSLHHASHTLQMPVRKNSGRSRQTSGRARFPAPCDGVISVGGRERCLRLHLSSIQTTTCSGVVLRTNGVQPARSAIKESLSEASFGDYAAWVPSASRSRHCLMAGREKATSRG